MAIRLSELQREGIELVEEDTPPAAAPEGRVRLSELEDPEIVAEPEPEAVPVTDRVREAAVSAAKGSAHLLASLPQAVGSLVQEFGEDLHDSPTFWSRAAEGEFLPLAQDLTRPNKIPGLPLGLNQLKTYLQLIPQLRDADERVTKAGRRIIETNQRFIEAHPEAFQTADGKLNEFMFNLGSGATTLAAAIGLSLATKSPHASAAMFGLYQKASLYQEARGAGKDPQTARTLSTLGGVVEGGLEYAGLNYFLKNYGGRVMTHLVRAGEEAAQEWAQQVGENAVAANWRQYRSFWDLFRGAGQAALIGGLLGTGASVGISTAEEAGLIHRLEQIGIPRKDAKKLAEDVVYRQTEEFGKQVEELTDKELGPLPEPITGTPQPADPLTQQVEELEGRLTPYDTPEVIDARRRQAQFASTHEIGDPERNLLRRSVAEKLYGKGAAKKERRADIVLGPPAAGKSKVAVKPIAAANGSIVIDADDAKPLLLPPDQKNLFGYVHVESAQIAENMVLARALGAGDNIVLPLVGKNSKKIQTLVKELRAAGYDVHLTLVDLAADEAARRAVTRFQEEGRFVDPDYVLNRVGNSPSQTYEELVKQGGLSSHGKYSNNVPKGAAPLFVGGSETYQSFLPAATRGPGGRPGPQHAQTAQPQAAASEQVTPGPESPAAAQQQLRELLTPGAPSSSSPLTPAAIILKARLKRLSEVLKNTDQLITSLEQQRGMLLQQRSERAEGDSAERQLSKIEVLHQIREDVEAGEAGRRVRGEAGEVIGIPSSYPDYFKNRGYTKKEVLQILDKALTRKPLTKKQSRILDNLVTGKRAELRSAARPKRPSTSTQGIDARLKILYRRSEALESELVSLLTAAPDSLRNELIAKTGTLNLQQVEQVARQQRAAGVSEARQQTVHEQRIRQAAKKAKIVSAFRSRMTETSEMQERITEYAKEHLPLASRGKFLAALKNAVSGDDLNVSVNRMLRVLHQMEVEADKAQRRDALIRIKEAIGEAMDAQNVSVDYQQKIKALVEGVELHGHTKATMDRLQATRDYIDRQHALGNDVELPAEVLRRIEVLGRKPVDQIPTRHLFSLLEQIERLTALGRTKFEIGQRLAEREREHLRRELLTGSSPLEQKVPHQTGPGQMLPMSERIANLFINALNRAQKIDLSLMPMDVIFDLLDQPGSGYYGVNSRLIKHRLDADFGRFLELKESWVLPVMQLSKRLGLKAHHFERIGVHAYRMQPGGVDYLLHMGVTQEQIDGIELNKEELQLYQAMREAIERPYAETQSTLRAVYNRQMRKLLNYFPVQTDWDKMSDTEVVDLTDAPEFIRLTKHVDHGFTEERRGGRQPVKLDALDIFQKHMTDVAYFNSMARDIKLLTEVVRSPEYAAGAGKLGQELVLKWLDLMARMGGTNAEKKIAWLDSLRRNFGAAQLGFKLSSFLIQPTAMFDGAARLGGTYAFDGLRRVTVDQRWRRFVSDNSPELRNRGADDPAYQELATNPLLAKWQAAGYTALQMADMHTAAGIFAGAYQKALDEAGIPLDLEHPNREALQKAELSLRRTQASAYFKDTPLAVSRGSLSGNKSLDKLLLQFRTFTLTRWSQIRHDAWRAGYKEGDFVKGTRVLAWLTAANFAEAGIRAASSKTVLVASMAALATGEWEPIQRALDEEFEDYPDDVLREILSSVPFAGDLILGYHYRSSAIPAMAFYNNLQQGIGQMMVGKSPDSKVAGAVRLLEGVGQIAGIPGSSQAGQIIRAGINYQPPGRRSRRSSRRRRNR